MNTERAPLVSNNQFGGMSDGHIKTESRVPVTVELAAVPLSRVMLITLRDQFMAL